MRTSLAFKFVVIARKMGVKFDPMSSKEVKDMRAAIDELQDGIQFEIGLHPDGSWSARSTNVDGIITGGVDQSDVSEMIKDAIFTYYDVPPQFCVDALLKGSGEKKTVKNEMLVTA